MKKDILCIGATHGDEAIGPNVLGALEKRYSDSFDWIVGNPRAFEKSVRYTDTDLNRSAPGNKTSDIYEERQAAEIIEKAKKYTYTIDVHGSVKETGIFIIITNPTEENFKLASMLRIPKIVIWPSNSAEMTGPLSECFPCGFEIECGKRDDPRIEKELKEILTDFLTNYKERENIGWKERLRQKKIYTMYGSLKKSECIDPSKLKEFKQTTLNQETFTSVFIGSYDYEDLLCYKLKQTNVDEVLAATT